MSVFHIHQWKEVARVYIPSSQTRMEATGVTTELVQKLRGNITSVELACDCGDVKELILCGDHTQRA